MNKSESIQELAAALSKFQGEIKNPSNTATNPFFKSKYAPLNDVLNLVRPILSKHGLSVVQAPSGDGENIVVTTTLLHESGEWMEFPELILKADKPTAQGAGSAITYARRYAISAILGISSEDDDDGNHAEPDTPKPTTPKAEKNKGQSTPKSKTDTDKQAIVDNSLASDAQITYINNLSSKKGYTIDALVSYIKTAYNKTDIKALSKQEAGEVINMLNGMGTN